MGSSLLLHLFSPLLHHNDFLFIDVDPLIPELEVTPAEVNLGSCRSVCVMYTGSMADTSVLWLG